jgi:hypothetical protein
MSFQGFGLLNWQKDKKMILGSQAITEEIRSMTTKKQIKTIT